MGWMVDVAHGPTLAAHPVGEGERLAAGARAGDYRVDRFIGAGAMGEVYAGHHPVIGKRVAIKVLVRELAASEEAAKRFVREAQAVNQIDHPNVVNIFAFGRLDDGRLYLVMDLVEGRSLREVVTAGPVEFTETLEILSMIAEALDAAHARGVVHRDLKPDNIVLSSRSKVFVLDFGLAKLVSKANEGETAPGTLTGQGTWMGTPGYMAPEQWSADGAGTASDRYALGVIAFELLSGKLPFSATSVPAMMEQHFRAEVPALSTRGVVLPVGIDAVLKRALAKDPEARFPTAHAMVEALRTAGGTGIMPARAAMAAPERDGKRTMMIPAVAGTGVLGVAVVAFMAVRGGSNKPAEPAVAPDGQAGTVRIEITSTPARAEVRQGDHVVGVTPVPLFVKPGAAATIVLRKPGYLPEQRTITAKSSDSVEQIPLLLVTRFEGVWQLPNGELRAFDRRGDQVDVSKVDEVAGPKHFFRHYELAAADQGIAFAGDEEAVDLRAPDDPQCHVRVHVEYRYTPSDDVLELRREKAKIDLVDGRCVLAAKTVETTKLVRVDHNVDTSEIAAPVGIPIKSPQKRKSAKIVPLDPKAALQNKIDAAAKAVKTATNTKLDQAAALKKKAAVVAENNPDNAEQTTSGNLANANAPDTVGNQATSPYNQLTNRGDSQQAQNPPPPQQVQAPQILKQ
ncbi:MAG: serine/threonine protein kinase [Myxococcales bacterium]|nr:serine/threonine protein kinase [Myxococcales bacterium]